MARTFAGPSGLVRLVIKGWYPQSPRDGNFMTVTIHTYRFVPVGLADNSLAIYCWESQKRDQSRRDG